MNDSKLYNDFTLKQIENFIERIGRKNPSFIELWPRNVDENTTLKEHLRTFGISEHTSIDIPYRLGYETQEIVSDYNLLLHVKIDRVDFKVPNWEEDWKHVPADQRPAPWVNKPLPSADMVTNINVSGWVNNQQSFWENAHRMCKKNGLIFSLLPSIMPSTLNEEKGWGKKDKEGQGAYIQYYYDTDFFSILASKNNYEILVNATIDDESTGFFENESRTFCVFRKINEEEFKGGGTLQRHRKV